MLGFVLFTISTTYLEVLIRNLRKVLRMYGEDNSVHVETEFLAFHHCVRKAGVLVGSQDAEVASD